MSNNLLDVISYEGDRHILVHKAEVMDFNTKSQLIVKEYQEALFFKDGEHVGTFGPGRHSLNSNNLPGLKGVFEKIFGGKNPFQCEVYFVNKSMTLNIDWGTPSPFSVKDPLRKGVRAFISANGTFGIRINDSERFFVELNLKDDCSPEAIEDQIYSHILTRFRQEFSKIIESKSVNLIDINPYLTDIADAVREELTKSVGEQIGIKITNFAFDYIDASGEEFDNAIKEETARTIAKTRAFSEAETTAIRASGDAEATAILASGNARAKRIEGAADIDVEEARMQRLGYSFQEKERFDILKTAAQNEGAAGAMMSTSMGLGMGFGVGGEVGRMANQTMAQGATRVACPGCGTLAVQGTKFCSRCGCSLAPKLPHCVSCGAELAPNAKFCSNCGASQAPLQKVCSACGAKLDVNARFCPACGSKTD